MSDENKTMDAVTDAGEVPNMEALQGEYENAWSQDEHAEGRINFVENIRYARWIGRSLDGLKHADTLAEHGMEARPFDGAPDTQIFLADGVINSLVDILYEAFFSARVKVSPTTGRTMDAAQAAEWRAVISWLIHGPLREALIDDVELTAQIMCTLGWCVLHPTWRNSKQLRMQKLTMEEIFKIALQAVKQNPSSPGLLAQAPDLIMDPTMEGAAIELLQHFFPDFSKAEARKVVRELRTNQEAEFPVAVETSIGPELGVLCPWYHFIMPIEGTTNPRNARVMFVRTTLPRWKLDELAAEEEWDDPLFVELLKAARGKGEKTQKTDEDERDANMQLCVLVYAFSWRVRNGVPGLYCTVMSPQVKPGNDAAGKPKPGSYGRDWMVDLAHKKMPFVFQQMEVTGWRSGDSRGVPDVLVTAQMEMKQQRDATFIYSQLSITPPIQKPGTSASKLPPEMGPFAIINNAAGKPWERLDLTSGANPEIAFKLTELVRKESEDYFGIPREDQPAIRWQLRQKRLVNRWLAKWGECFWQLSVLAYQNMTPAEIKEILGRAPMLTADIIARHKLVLWYDVRAGDGEWLDNLFNRVIQILQTDTGGSIDHNKLVNLLLSYLDPTLAEEVTMDQAGAKQAVFKATRDEINNVMLGNKPLLVEKDPTARMKMLFAQQIVKGNPEFATRLDKASPHFNPGIAENFETLMKNLQHSYQETTLSKAQGRLGVGDVDGQPG